MRWFKRRGEHEDSETDVERVDAVSPNEPIAGDRGPPSVIRAPSLQSRVSNLLAFGLMVLLGVGMLTWYYARVISQRSQAQESTRSALQTRAEGAVKLPPLGPIETPAGESSLLSGAPEEPPTDDVPDAWLEPAVEVTASRPVGPPVKTPEELALERKLSGRVVAANVLAPTPMPVSVSQGEAAMLSGERQVEGATMAALLNPTVTPAARAQVLPTRRLLLPKGAFLDCTLETAIDSTLPGMTTCVTATDTFGVDGSVVLMERGTKLVGETRGQVQPGSARIFVLWTQARTPTGVVIPLASPGTDELGRSGLPGQVNRHFFERFGAAILISVIDGAIQREVHARNSAGTVIYEPSTSQDIATEVLKSTVNIPPTVTKRHGDRIQILVARDLDFRTVYELRPTAAQP